MDIARDTNEPQDVNECFICCGSEDEVLSGKLCCSVLYFHPKCISEFYNKTDKTCPICRTDISSYFSSVHSNKINRKKCTKLVLKIIGLILFLSSMILGFVMYDILRKNNSKSVSRPFLFININIPIWTLIIAVPKRVIEQSKYRRFLQFIRSMFIYSCVTISMSYSVLVLMSIISINNNNTPSYDAVVYTNIILLSGGVVGGIVATCMYLMYILGKYFCAGTVCADALFCYKYLYNLLFEYCAEEPVHTINPEYVVKEDPPGSV